MGAVRKSLCRVIAGIAAQLPALFTQVWHGALTCFCGMKKSYVFCATRNPQPVTHMPRPTLMAAAPNATAPTVPAAVPAMLDTRLPTLANTMVYQP